MLFFSPPFPSLKLRQARQGSRKAKRSNLSDSHSLARIDYKLVKQIHVEHRPEHRLHPMTLPPSMAPLIAPFKPPLLKSAF